MAALLGAPPAGDADRPRRDGQDPPGAAGGGRAPLAAYPDGVWLAELAALADPALVPQAAAAAVGVREEPGRPLLATLADALRPRRLLLVLDNCEHLLDACARLADALLRACPRLRHPGHQPGGAGHRRARRCGASPPCPSRRPGPPAPGRRPAAPGPRPVRGGAPVRRAGGGGAAGVRPHRRERARRWRRSAPGWTASPWPSSWPPPACGCCPPAQLLARLEDRFRLLTGGSRTALARHQTLRAAVDWSYDLLTDAGAGAVRPPGGLRRRLDAGGGRGGRRRATGDRARRRCSTC